MGPSSTHSPSQPRQTAARWRQAQTVTSTLVRTPAEVRSVWPKPSFILPVQEISALSLEDAAHLVSMFDRSQILAYRCLRWARWMTPTRDLIVTCPYCQGRAQSYCVMSSRVGKNYRNDEGKWQWLCQNSRCKKQFCDTTGTPFFRSSYPFGLVLAALAYGGPTILTLLARADRQMDIKPLQALLEKFTREKTSTASSFRRHLRLYARLFVDTVLLAHCQGRNYALKGEAAIDRRIKNIQKNRLILDEQATDRKHPLRTQYSTIACVLSQLRTHDRSRLWKITTKTKTTATKMTRKDLLSQLHKAVAALTTPLPNHELSIQDVLNDTPPLVPERAHRPVRPAQSKP